jgi:hypothetical protein
MFQDEEYTRNEAIWKQVGAQLERETYEKHTRTEPERA